MEVLTPEEPSVAVLPFANMSGDPENEYFSDGLAEEIINALTRFGGLKVIARTSAFAFKGRNQDVRQIAQILGVTNVLEGGVRRAGDRVRITAQLVAAKDGGHLWAQRFDRSMTDNFAVQDEIAEAITGALQVQLLNTPPSRRRRTVNLEAYEANLEGRFHLSQWSKTASERARRCFERAITLDPGYAAPNAGLAEYYCYRATDLNARPRDVYHAARAAAERAVELDDENAEAHMARGLVRATYLHDWSGAKVDFDRALKLNPKSGLSHARRCNYYWCQRGSFEEGLLDVRRAIQLDPLNPVVRSGEVTALGMLSRFDDAVDRAVPITQACPSYWVGWLQLGWALALGGRFDEAETAVRKGSAAEILPLFDGLLAYIHGLKGERPKAEGIRGRLEEAARNEFVSSLALALAAAGCEDIERVYSCLEKGLEEREYLAVMVLRLPLFPGHLSHPACHRLLHKAGLE
jgi:serine/threonine-protein kinase